MIYGHFMVIYDDFMLDHNFWCWETPPMPRAARAYPATTGVTLSSCKPPFRAWQVETHETPENDGE